MSLRTLRSTVIARAGLALVVMLIVTAAATLAVPVLAQTPSGTTILVNTFDDAKRASDGFCTLREAIISANSDSASGNAQGECPAGNGADLILLPPGTYMLTRSDNGQEDASTTGDLDIRGPVTIQPTGAGLVVIDGSVATNRVLHVMGSGVVISRLTLRGGMSNRSGGGFFSDVDASVRLENVTITGNHADVSGGGVANSGLLTLVNVTIQDNNAPLADAIVNSGTLTVGNTIVGSNGTGGVADCSGTLTAGGPNVVSDSSCSSGATTLVADPVLNADLDSGGKATFFRLGAGSPAINAGASAICPALDQLGTTRPQLGACDVGAHEPTSASPVARPATVTTNEDVAVTIALNGVGYGSSLTFAIGTQPTKGTLSNLTQVSPTSASVLYTPNHNANGADSFTFTVNDGHGASAPATVSIQITPVNDQPVAGNDSLSTSEDTAANVNVATNDSDVDGNLDLNSITIQTAAAKGVATPAGNGVVAYTPNRNANGSDSFVYRICDTQNSCATATVSVSIAAVNDAPIAADDALTTDEDTAKYINVSSNDGDVDGNLNPNSVTIKTAPTKGVAEPTSVGVVKYTPTLNANGSDSFVYQICDSLNACATATVAVTITPVNDVPVAANDSLTTAEDTAKLIDVAANDSDVDGNLNPNSVSIQTAPTRGVATPAGNGVVNYTPNANANGSDSFVYRICDSANACVTATVSVTITPANDPPVGHNDAYKVAEDTTLNIAAPGVLQNDTDPDGDPRSAAILAQAAHGVVTLHATGAFVYVPAKNYDGADSFTYTVSDGKGGSATATVNLTVTPDAFYEVMNTNDSGTSSLRAAIDRANATPGLNTITFDIDGAGPHKIALLSQLAPLSSPVLIDGNTQPQGDVVVDGGGQPFPCFVILSGASGTTIRGLVIQNCGSHGIVIDHSGTNTIDGNTIQNNGGDGIHIVGDPNDLVGSGGNVITNNTITGNGTNGVTIIDSVNNNLVNNDIHGNTGLSVDLGGDGPTPNDPGDTDTGANYKQNFPSLVRAVPANSASAAQAQAVTGQIVGWLNSKPNTTFTIRVYAGPGCSDAQQRLLSTTPPTVTTDGDGNSYFTLSVTSPFAANEVLRTTATDATGNTSEYSDCVISSTDNDSWPRALVLNGLNGPVTVQQYLDQLGQARWYRFRVQPHSQVTIALTDLPANYDMTLYKDIAQTYQELTTAQDNVQLSAEFAPQAFSPQAFSPQAFSSSAFSPQAFSPQAFSPQAFSPQAFSPQAFSPQAFSPQAFSPQAFSPQAFSPQAFSPQAFSPQAFSTDAFMPTVLDPSSFSSAQTRSIIGVSAFDGNANEGIIINTWTNDADFYVRVRGREGAFNLNAPYKLTVQVTPGPCAALMALPALPATSLTAPSANTRSIILVDGARLRQRYSAAEVDALLAQLGTLAARPEVAGAIVDVSGDNRVAAANQRADQFKECVYAKNQVVESIKAIVDRYRAANPLHYVVIVGNDEVIPFFRYPDNALLGHESDYVPPVLDQTASQASLRLGYVLSQDLYGSRVQVSLNATEFPIPDLPVGRLVETPSDIKTLLDAYLSTSGGVAPAPASSLVTGYDFLADAANAVRDQLAAGIGVAPDTLITPKEISPLDSRSWTADQLRAELQTRHDIVFLAGHFNAASALAADYRTSVLSTDVLNSSANMTNALIYSAGCHSGYNIVNADGVPGVTFEPDWAQTFAQKGATLVAGTGYQYGDTDFIEYSERLYLEFTKQLRMGTGPVSVGDALVGAKQRYLATTPSLKGAHEKSVLETTLFGLPMFSINMPGQRLTPNVDTPAVASLTPFTTNPGKLLGLQSADLTVNPSLAVRTLELQNVENNTTIVSTWLEGDDGVLTNPAQPALPLVVKNVSVAGNLLRGVGLRGGAYTDTPNIIPLTGAPVSELRGVHSPFQSDVFFPLRPWSVNFFDLLTTGEQNGTTRLNLTPAQYQSTAPGSQTSMQRQFSQIDLRLFYVENPALAAANGVPLALLADMPTIVRVQGIALTDTVEFRATVVGNPAVGMQNVWVTYTAIDGPLYGKWQSLDLVQDAKDSTLWKARLPLNGRPALSLRYIVQAVNGVGMVSLVDNIGRYYIPGVEGDQLPTVLTLEPLATGSDAATNSGAFGTTVQFDATLKRADGTPLAGQSVTFGVGPQTRLALTDQNGRAQTSIPLLGLPGSYPVQAAFAGTAELAAASSTSVNLFTILQQTSLLTLDPVAAVGQQAKLDGKVPAGATTATLMDAAGRRLVEQTVFFEVKPQADAASAGATTVTQPVITNLVGEAKLGALNLPVGKYDLTVWFDGATSHTPVTAHGTLDIFAPTADPIVNEPMNLHLFLPLVDK